MCVRSETLLTFDDNSSNQVNASCEIHVYNISKWFTACIPVLEHIYGDSFKY